MSIKESPPWEAPHPLGRLELPAEALGSGEAALEGGGGCVVHSPSNSAGLSRDLRDDTGQEHFQGADSPWAQGWQQLPSRCLRKDRGYRHQLQLPLL